MNLRDADRDVADLTEGPEGTVVGTVDGCESLCPAVGLCALTLQVKPDGASREVKRAVASIGEAVASALGRGRTLRLLLYWQQPF